MINKRYTDEEIMEALANCAFSAHNPDACKECHYNNVGAPTCVASCTNDALDLINRQKSEIERLRAEVETRTQEKLALGRIYTQKLKTVKYETYYEAYKEFAERIRECCDLNNDLSTDAWLSVTADINCVLKEMTGE